MSLSNSGAEPLASLQTRDLWFALALFLAWTLGLSALMHGYATQQYFPIADQWALIANSHPDFAHPLQWLSSGFSDYFVYDPAVSQPYANFIRPGFNGAYWLLGWGLAPESGGYLYFTYAVIGACAGLLFLLLRCHGSALLPALVLGALVPLTPPLLPEIGTLLVPYAAFDPLGAALGLAALLAFSARRWWLTAALLLWALFTKETSLPILGAILGLYLLQWWRAAAPRPSPWPLLLLAAPLLLWIAARLLAFGNMAGGVYVLQGGLADKLRHLLHTALQWPFWLEELPFHLNAGMGQKLQAWMLLAANLGFMAAAAGIIVMRWLRRRALPHAVELALVLSWAFMALVGVADRLGVVLAVCVLACAGIWQAQRQYPRLALLALLSLGLGLTATAWRAVGHWRQIEPLVLDYSALSRQYLAELKTFKHGDTVLVLNDPVSWHSQIRWLRQAGGVEADLVKAADFACPSSAARLRQPCKVELHPGAQAGQYEFSQSCGIDWCGAFVPHTTPVRLHPAEGVEVELLPGAAAAGATTQWSTLRLRLARPGAQLLYFDPADRSFHRFNTTSAQAAASPEKP